MSTSRYSSESSSQTSQDHTRPQPLHAETNNFSRRASISSNTSGLRSSNVSLRERIFKTNTRNEDEDLINQDNYSEKKIFQDLNDEEIEMRRTQSRVTILNTLESRIAQEQSDLQEHDTESSLGLEKKQSIYENIDREDGLPTENDGVEFQEIDPELVTWDGDDDKQNPRNWSLARKWRTAGTVALYTLLSPFASTMLSPAVSEISTEFGITNVSISALLVSIYVLAWALFSPIVAPFSEMYGRKYVCDISIWFLFFFNLGCALSQTTAQLSVFRLFAGIGGCAPICIGAGVLGDLFDNKDRGLAMSFFSIGPTIGPTLSALISGIIVQYVDWRWCFWVLCIFNACIAVAGFFLLEETYAPTLLSRKAAKLRKATGNENLHSIYEVVTGETIYDKFAINLTRPISLLFTHPMVFGLGSFMAIVYGCLYIIIICFPQVYAKVYGFNKLQTGLMYISLLVGYLLGTAATQAVADRIYTTMKAKNGGVSKPEFRLPLLLQSGLLCSVGLFWFGWGAQHHLHYVFPAVGAGIFSFGVVAVFYTIQNYLVEMNIRFAASSIAAVSVFRSLFGFAFPLFATQMFDRLGYGWGCSIFAFIAVATGIPFPLFIILYGERLRLWANKRMDKSQAERDARMLAKLKAKEEKKQLKQRDINSNSSQSTEKSS